MFSRFLTSCGCLANRVERALHTSVILTNEKLAFSQYRVIWYYVTSILLCAIDYFDKNLRYSFKFVLLIFIIARKFLRSFGQHYYKRYEYSGIV